MPLPKDRIPILTAEEGQQLTDFARAAVEASVRGQSKFKGSLSCAATLCSGVFVSLKRGRQLRACLGNLSENELAPLGNMLEAAASQVGMLDTRFPRIHHRELPFLKVEVSVMHDLKITDGPAANRPSEIEVGTHGVIISHRKKRGLLLPQVAVEKGWSATEFLDHSCRKAGLPAGFWEREDTVMKTFRGEEFESDPLGGIELIPGDLTKADRQALFEIVKSGFEGKSGQFSVSSTLVWPQPAPTGVYLECEDGKNALVLQQKVTLIDLIKQATRSVLHENPKPAPLAKLVILSHPIALNSGDEPERFESVRNWVVMSRNQERVSFVLKPGLKAIETGLIQIGVEPDKWSESGAEVTVFKPNEIELVSKQQGQFDESTGLVRKAPTKQQGTFDEPTGLVRKSREPIAAGKFYPATADAIQTALDNYFFRVPFDTSLEDCRAIMLPHAGWEFCGEIIAETVSRAKIPERIVIIGPKHTSDGADWSVSGSSEWKLPHEKIPIDTEGVEFFSKSVRKLTIEDEAHENEHGIEVLLPFLLWSNPRLKLVPIAIGGGDLNDLEPLANALKEWRARVIEQDGRAPLFIISSDLNHFADDAENRRLDELALDELRAGSPEGLFKTCLENEISMCGMRPAAAILSALNSEQACDVEITKYDTSAKVSGDSNRVVGYAGALFK